MDGIFRKLILAKCPKCGIGNCFEVQNPYNLTRFSKMNKYCPHCGLDLKQEPGFYFGAGYLSYAIQAIWFAVTFFVLYFGFDAEGVKVLIVSILLIIITTPYNFRLSRVLWLMISANYNLTKKNGNN